MKIIGNLDFNLNQAKRLLCEMINDFPVGAVGRLIYHTVLNQLFLCTATVPSDVWLPLAGGGTIFVHDQTTVTATWNVTHQLGSEDVFIQVYDMNGYQVTPTEIHVIDAANISITFPTAQAGKAVVAVLNETALAHTLLHEMFQLDTGVMKTMVKKTMLPDVSGTISIGDATHKFDSIYADTLMVGGRSIGSDVDYLQAYTGGADGVSSPVYSSLNYIIQNTPLVTALGAIDSKVKLAVNAEVTARTLGDNTLQNNINTEISNRTAADTALQININTLTTANTSAHGTISTALTAETDNRIAADTTIQNNLNALITSNTAAHNAFSLQSIYDQTVGDVAGAASITLTTGKDFRIYDDTNSAIFFAVDSETGAVSISGDLLVTGTTTTINSATLSIADNFVIVNSDVTTAPTTNAGLTVNRGTSIDVSIFWDEANDLWKATAVDGVNQTLWHSGNDGSGSGLDADKLDGYHGSEASTGSTIALRNGSGDINARLFRSEYDSTNPTVNLIMTQVDSVSNNYIRPTTPAQFRTSVIDPFYLRRDETSLPTANNVYNLGSATAKWANIYATTFQGNATSANFADLAEKYRGKDLPIGTVVQIATSGEYEVEECLMDNSNKVVGVISENPGFLLNSESEGPPVALKGKVRVRILGLISKGDTIVSAGKGCARRGSYFEPEPNKIGYATEGNSNHKEKLVMCIIV